MGAVLAPSTDNPPQGEETSPFENQERGGLRGKQHLFPQRVAVVTGASSGIGAATARALATSGAVVALLARRPDRIIAIAHDIEVAGGRALAFAADVTDLSVLEQIAQRVRDELGCVDILINNAGMMLSAPFAQQHGYWWRSQKGATGPHALTWKR